MTDATTTKFTCEGAITGRCGIAHRSIRTALRCIERHSAAVPCANYHSRFRRFNVAQRFAFSDRCVHELTHDAAGNPHTVPVSAEAWNDFVWDGRPPQGPMPVAS